jgi:ABC-type uncharacterized transport system permease subunit
MGMMTFVGASLAYKGVRPMGVLMLPVSFGLMVLGGILPCHPLGPSPVFKDWELWGHVIGGGFTYGFAFLAAAMGLFYLLKAKGKTGYPYDQLPDLEVLDRLNYRFVLVSFILATIMVHFAFLWAHTKLPADFVARAGNSIILLVWGYWMVYAVWLGLRWGLRWKGKKLAVYSPIALILVMVFTFYVAPFREKGYHTGPFFPPYNQPDHMKQFLKKNMESTVKPAKSSDYSESVSPLRDSVKVAKAGETKE